MARALKRSKGLKRRVIIAAILGLLLGSLAIWTFSTVYNPFMNDVPDLRAVVPEDVDWMIESRAFPVLVKGLETGRFYAQLDKNLDFQRWRSTPSVRESAAVKLLHRVFDNLNGDLPKIPGGIELLGDLSGSQVLIAGYDRDVRPGVPSIVAVVKPEAQRVIAGANVLLDERLCAWFVKEKIAARDIQHSGDSVSMVLDLDGREVPFALARIDNVLLAGTDVDVVQRQAVQLRREGLSPLPPARFDPQGIWGEHDDTSLNVLARSTMVDQTLALREKVLVPAFGRYAPAFERFFPHLEGEDVYAKIGLGDVAEVRARVASRGRTPNDGPTRMTPLDPARVHAQMEDVLSVLPHYTFGYLYAGMAPIDLVTYLCHEPTLFDKDKKKLWFDLAVERLPRFKNVPRDRDPSRAPDLLPALERELRATFEDEIGVALFKQQRLEKIASATPGVAVILRLKDRKRLEGLIQEIAAGVDPDVTPFERYDDDPRLTLWHVTARGLVDDATITKPGFAIIGDYFIVTNWVQALIDMKAVLQKPGTGFAGRDEIAHDLESVPPGVSSFLYIDAEQLFAYFDDAKEGWVKERSTVSEIEKIRQRRLFEKMAIDQQIPPEQRDRYVEAKWHVWYDQRLTGDKNPAAIRREIDATLGYFRTAFRSVFAAVGVDGGDFNVLLRIATRE
jgi:hypothetical protein